MRSGLLALLILAGCVREATQLPQETQPAPLPSASASAPDAPTQPADLSEAGARAFVERFLEARQKGDEAGARASLSAIARDQFEQGEGGLKLLGPFADWEVVAVNAADASSFEVQVRLREAGGTFEETLFVGPGPDSGNVQRPWVIRGAMRG